MKVSLTPLLIAGLCVLAVGGVITLTIYSEHQAEQAEIAELYDQCMSDKGLSLIVKGTSNQKNVCQCRAEILHDADMRLMDTLELADEYALMRTSSQTGITTDSEGLANVGSHYYCVAKVREEE